MLCVCGSCAAGGLHSELKSTGPTVPIGRSSQKTCAAASIGYIGHLLGQGDQAQVGQSDSTDSCAAARYGALTLQQVPGPGTTINHRTYPCLPHTLV
jgi:hypothetical protein